MRQFHLTTGLVLLNSRADAKEYFKHEKHIPEFAVDGTEEQIFFKVTRNLLNIFAKTYAGDDHEKFLSEIKRLNEKYNLEQFKPT